MRSVEPRWPAALALGASLLGLAFSASSTIDYASHLDRQIHDLHCSFIPGLDAAGSADTGCRAAMYSPYSALFRDRYWGGIPISLFALGAFAFFAAFALYMLLARSSAPRRASQFLFVTGITPLLVSILMFVISLVRLGTFCKTCVGIYISSAGLAAAGIAAFVYDRQAARRAAETQRMASPLDNNRREAPRALEPEEAPRPASEGVAATVVDDGAYEPKPVIKPAPTLPVDAPRRTGGPLLLPAWLLGLGLFSVVPALLYVGALPSYTGYIQGCGKLEKPAEPSGALLKIATPRATQPATLVVDPLCPTCKALHQRLVAEGIFDKLDTTLVLFPLDSECNWMLDRSLHPGACIISKAILCSEHRALPVLEWAYDNQEDILAVAKAGAGLVNVRAMVRERWPGLETCIESKDITQRLHKMLRYTVSNQLPVSTPQMFLGDTRVCDEDTDIGLAYTLRKLAPALEAR